MLLKAFIYETTNPSTELLKDVFDLIQQNILTSEFHITKIVDFLSHISLEFKVDNVLNGELFYNVESKNLEITIKKCGNSTKFKLRYPKYLYTISVSDNSKVEKIKAAINSKVQRIDLTGKKSKGDKKETGKKAKTQ